MRIAFIVNRFPALSESFVLKQIVGLLDMGHDVEIFAEENPKMSMGRVHTSKPRAHFFYISGGTWFVNHESI